MSIRATDHRVFSVPVGAPDPQRRRIVAAFLELGARRPEQLIELLDEDVEWHHGSRARRPTLGRDAVAAVIAEAARRGNPFDLTGIASRSGVLTFEFGRPWWGRPSRATLAALRLVGGVYLQDVTFGATIRRFDDRVEFDSRRRPAGVSSTD